MPTTLSDLINGLRLANSPVLDGARLRGRGRYDAVPGPPPVETDADETTESRPLSALSLSLVIIDMDCSGVIPAPRGEEKRNEFGRRCIECVDVRRDARPDGGAGAEKLSSEKAVPGVCGVASRSRERARWIGRAEVTVLGDTPRPMSWRDCLGEWPGPGGSGIVVPASVMGLSTIAWLLSSTMYVVSPSSYSSPSSSESSSSVRTSSRNSLISREMAARSSSIVVSDSTSSHLSNVE
jgi:hypothetical protein